MTEVEGIILDKLKSLEQKMDRNTAAFNDFQLKVQSDQSECKAELKDDMNKVKVNLIKLIAIIAASGTVGGGVSTLITKLF